MLRDSGLRDVGLDVRPQFYPPGHTRRTNRLGLVRSRRPQIVEMWLAGEAELDRLDHETRAHITDPDTISVLGFLSLAWGRKPR